MARHMKKTKKTGAAAVQENAMGIGHNKPLDVKALRSLIEDAKKIDKRRRDANGDMAANKIKATDLGVTRKAYNALLKEVLNPMPEEEKEAINELFFAYKDLPLFASAIESAAA